MKFDSSDRGEGRVVTQTRRCPESPVGDAGTNFVEAIRPVAGLERLDPSAKALDH
jgi:hypothetical protein